MFRKPLFGRSGSFVGLDPQNRILYLLEWLLTCMGRVIRAGLGHIARFSATVHCCVFFSVLFCGQSSAFWHEEIENQLELVLQLGPFGFGFWGATISATSLYLKHRMGGSDFGFATAVMRCSKSFP